MTENIPYSGAFALTKSHCGQSLSCLLPKIHLEHKSQFYIPVTAYANQLLWFISAIHFGLIQTQALRNTDICTSCTHFCDSQKGGWALVQSAFIKRYPQTCIIPEMKFSCYCGAINHWHFLCDRRIEFLFHIRIYLYSNIYCGATATWNSKDAQEFIEYPNINIIYQYLKTSAFHP